MASYIGAIDQGTTSTRFTVFDRSGRAVATAQKEHEQIYPQPGWVEHDAEEIWRRTQDVIAEAMQQRGLRANDIGAIGYATEAPILDLTGLASPEIIPYLRPAIPAEAGRGWNGASEAGLLEFLRARKPDYVVLFPSWYPSRFFQDGLGEAILRVDLEDNLICGDRTMIVYRPGWGAGVPWKDATSGD